MAGASAATALAAGSALAGSHDEKSHKPAHHEHHRRAGIQLYTVRASMDENVRATLQAIAGMGYREVEFAGYGDQSPQQVKALLEELNLSSPSAHMNARDLRADPQPMIELAHVVGHKYLTIGWIEADDRQTLDDWKGWVEACNRIGEACRVAGLRLAYHNHDFELLPVEGKMPLELLLEGVDSANMDFELDFFWARKAGFKVTDVLSMAPERFTMCHVKDMDSDGNMADVGEGIIDFNAILQDPVAGHIRHFFAERDDAKDPFRTAAISRLALKEILDLPH